MPSEGRKIELKSRGVAFKIGTQFRKFLVALPLHGPGGLDSVMD